MDSNISSTLGNPQGTLNNPGLSIKDTDMGHPLGDVVDNTVVKNPSKDPSKVYHSGSNLSGMSRPSFLSGIQKFSDN